MDIENHLSNFLLNITEHNIRVKRKVMRTGTHILERIDKMNTKSSYTFLEELAKRKSEHNLPEEYQSNLSNQSLKLDEVKQELSTEYLIHSDQTRIQISFTCDSFLILGVIFKDRSFVLFLNSNSKIVKIQSTLCHEVFKQLNFSSIAVHKDELKKCYYLLIMNINNSLVGIKLIDFDCYNLTNSTILEVELSFCLEMNVHVMIHGIDHLLKDRRFLLSKILYRSFKTDINSDYLAGIEEGIKVSAPLNYSITPLKSEKYAITIRNTEKYTNVIVIVKIENGLPEIINKYKIAKGTIKLIDFLVKDEDVVLIAFNHHQSPKDIYLGSLYLSSSDKFDICSKQELLKSISKIQFSNNQSIVVFFQESLNMSVCKILSIPTLQELLSKQVDNFKSSFYHKEENSNHIVFGNYSNAQTIEVYKLDCKEENIEKKLSYTLPDKTNPFAAHIVRLNSKQLSLLIIRNCKEDKQVKIRMVEFSIDY